MATRGSPVGPNAAARPKAEREGFGEAEATMATLLTHELGGTIPPKAERNTVKFEAFVKSEIDRWSPILKAAGASAN